MPFFTSPTSYRLNNPLASLQERDASSLYFTSLSQLTMAAKPPPHSSHPSFPHLVLLVFEAVLEVVCVSLPGYIVARQGMFNAEMQKFTANLNVMLFTPCLIFNKLASQLNADKLADLAVIPFIFAAQTLVSWVAAVAVSKLFGFTKRPRNFVIAMGVFGNSNSLPISLVLSLSHTISGLHWDKVPGDNDKEVGARGILYLLIFQQLGQLVRWTWGYNVLLAPPDQVDGEDEHTNSRLERGQYDEATREEDQPLIDDASLHEEDVQVDLLNNEGNEPVLKRVSTTGSKFRNSDSGDETPVTHQQYTSSLSSNDCKPTKQPTAPGLLTSPMNGHSKPSKQTNDDGKPADDEDVASLLDGVIPSEIRHLPGRTRKTVNHHIRLVAERTSSTSKSIFKALPTRVQTGLSKTGRGLARFGNGVWEFMNPPLWAMLVAIVVASIPALQSLFFTQGTFIENSVTSAIRQSGGVAVPLILVVLGANLARNTLPAETHTRASDKEETKLLIASLISRMVLPTIVMAPLLALAAKYVPVSILDDPIFVIVCFLLTGAPSALQLAQICQINNVYIGAMTRLLFQSYVVWILPSTLILVTCALEVVEWAQA
ncbi:MAG: hypothetical protein Q9191_004842 [Dirinaria sp. TL-2023a]